ncbi:MAG: hypothetical protein K0S98_774 [Propionibacteriaceae bacterium]|jgi:hypothetical protein|nr:hypothetical protein [Propionibacteriaceae bacterium]
MTTELQSLALSEARDRAWNSAEIEHYRLGGQHQVEVASRAAKVERQPER